jgi:hypothetical protein
MMDMFAEAPLTWVSPHDDGTLRAADDLELLRQALCADVDKQHAYANLRRMVPQSIASATGASTAPQRAHPATYIICEQDQTNPPARAGADGCFRRPRSPAPVIASAHGVDARQAR